MRILLTNHHLVNFAGTEIFTLEAGKQLKNLGHEVTVFTKFKGEMAKLFSRYNIPVVTDLKQFKKSSFDLLHVHHNICAYEARFFFPDTPMVFVSHGVQSYLEQPPAVNLGIGRYLAVSEAVKDNLISCGLTEKDIIIFRNLIDEKFFNEKKPINKKPETALIISNRLDEEKENIIKMVLRKKGIKSTWVGKNYQVTSYEDMPYYINQADIVFSFGRGAVEAMMAGRLPILLDKSGFAGMVTPKNFGELIKGNFSAKFNVKDLTPASLESEIKKYRIDNSTLLKELTLNEFSASSQGKKLVKIYEQILTKKPIVSKEVLKIAEAFTMANMETRNYTETLILNDASIYGILRVKRKIQNLINQNVF